MRRPNKPARSDDDDDLISQILEGFTSDTDEGENVGEDLAAALQKLRPDRGESQEAEMRGLLESLPGLGVEGALSEEPGVQRLLHPLGAEPPRPRERTTHPEVTPLSLPSIPRPRVDMLTSLPETLPPEVGATSVTLSDLFGPAPGEGAIGMPHPGLAPREVVTPRTDLQDLFNSEDLAGMVPSAAALAMNEPELREDVVDLLAPRRLFARKRVHRFFMESVRSVLCLRILRFFVVSALEKVSPDELEEELVEPGERIRTALGELVERGLVLMEQGRYSLNPRARGAITLANLIAAWQNVKSREEVWQWIREAES